MRVESHPAAQAESEDAQTWYEERSLLAAAGFLVTALVQVIAPVSAVAAVPPDSKFQKVALDTNTTNPMALDVAPDAFSTSNGCPL